MDSETRLCKYCGTPFKVSKSSRKKFCKPSHRTMFSQVKNNHRAPTEWMKKNLSEYKNANIPDSVKPEKKVDKEKLLKLMQTVSELRENEIQMEIAVLKVLESKDFYEYKAQLIAAKSWDKEIEMAETYQEYGRLEELNDKVEYLTELAEIAKPSYLKSIENINAIRDNILSNRLKMFRLITEINDLNRKLFLGDTQVLSGDNLKAFNSTQNYYDFSWLLYQRGSKYSNFNQLPYDRTKKSLLLGLDKIKLPFLAYLFGKTNTGKTLLSTKLVFELVEYFNAKVLYLADSIQWQKDLLENFEFHFKNLSHQNHSYQLGKIESSSNIFNFIDMGDFEFLFLDTRKLNLKIEFIKKIQSKYPKLSIFIIDQSNKNSIYEKSDIVIQFKEMAGCVIKGESRCFFPAIEGSDDWKSNQDDKNDKD